jgi:uncharacterized phage-associated protein
MMEEKITYRLDYRKAIEAIVWLANKKPKIDIYHIAKILYYAEKEHLNRYARPIIGDTYIAMSYGQVPSGVRDLITKNSWLDPDYLDCFSRSLTVNKKKLVALRKPDLRYFSETDIECLEESLLKYGDMPFEELKNTSHDERTWLETEPNKPIDYLLMIDENNPNKEEITEDIYLTSQYAKF